VLFLKPVEEKYRNENPRDLVAESIKSGYNPGSPSFIDIMQYHRGLLHQRGHGWGAIAKVAARVAAPVIAQVVGGLLGGAQGGAQTGQAIQTGHGGMDDFLNTAIVAGHLFGDKKEPTGYYTDGKFVKNKKNSVRWRSQACQTSTERQRIHHGPIENGGQTSFESGCSDGIRCIR
jgi:hypothetical protein